MYFKQFYVDFFFDFRNFLDGLGNPLGLWRLTFGPPGKSDSPPNSLSASANAHRIRYLLVICLQINFPLQNGCLAASLGLSSGLKNVHFVADIVKNPNSTGSAIASTSSLSSELISTQFYKPNWPQTPFRNISWAIFEDFENVQQS